MSTGRDRGIGRRAGLRKHGGVAADETWPNRADKLKPLEKQTLRSGNVRGRAGIVRQWTITRKLPKTTETIGVRQRVLAPSAKPKIPASGELSVKSSF